MGAAGVLPVGHLFQVNARADDVLALAAGVVDGFLDDGEAAQGLAVKIAGAGDAATRRNRRGAGDGDVRPTRTAREKPI